MRTKVPTKELIPTRLFFFFAGQGGARANHWDKTVGSQGLNIYGLDPGTPLLACGTPYLDTSTPSMAGSTPPPEISLPDHSQQRSRC